MKGVERPSVLHTFYTLETFPKSKNKDNHPYI
jgi:hypothetical protein